MSKLKNTKNFQVNKKVGGWEVVRYGVPDTYLYKTKRVALDQLLRSGELDDWEREQGYVSFGPRTKRQSLLLKERPLDTARRKPSTLSQLMGMKPAVIGEKPKVYKTHGGKSSQEIAREARSKRFTVRSNPRSPTLPASYCGYNLDHEPTRSGKGKQVYVTRSEDNSYVTTTPTIKKAREYIDKVVGRTHFPAWKPGSVHARPNPRRNHPTGADEPLAYKLASALRWQHKNGLQGEALAKHLVGVAKKTGFDRERYGEFLAKSHVMPAAVTYYGNVRDAREFATHPNRCLAGELFVDHVLSGEWSPKSR